MKIREGRLLQLIDRVRAASMDWHNEYSMRDEFEAIVEGAFRDLVRDAQEMCAAVADMEYDLVKGAPSYEGDRLHPEDVAERIAAKIRGL